MQKMNILDIKMNVKKESGVTMIALVIMIIIMLILAGVSLYIGGTSMKDIVERQDLSTLNMIQEIAISQYTKALAVGQTGVPIVGNEVQPKMFFGQCIKDRDLYNSIVKPTGGSIFPSEDDYVNNLNTYDDCYYRLTGTDLRNLGIADATENNGSVHSYIVKYSTGEVYDETLANAQYYVKGNRNIKEEVNNTVKSIETSDFVD